MHTQEDIYEKHKHVKNIHEKDAEPKNDSLCLVTSFMDIGRDGWKVYSRTVDEYFTSFMPYIYLNHDVVVFMDDRHVQLLISFVNQLKPIANIIIIPINWKWMRTYIHAYSKIDTEQRIMDSIKFQKFIWHRKDCPETYCPEYNIMQHSKIDFVCYAIDNKLSDAVYFAWTDFGYFKNDAMMYGKNKNKLDINKFKLDKINFQTINPVDEDDKNIAYTLTYAPEKIGGFFYLGDSRLLKEYQQLYHEIYDEIHGLGLVDDDQHFMLRCYFRKKELFYLWDLGGWHKIYTTFCV
jgi:hypothetical protein